MKNIITFFLYISLILLNNCSFDKKTGIWKEHNKEIIERVKNKNVEKVFKSNKIFDEEILNNNKISVTKSEKNLNWLEDNFSQSNNVLHFYYINNKNNISKSKKIGKSSFTDKNINPEPLINDKNLFFSDLSGNIFKYSLDKKILIWKFNFYKKKYKNLPKKINLKIKLNNLIASDNLGFLYKLDLNTGMIVWAKSQGVPLTSEIKSLKDKIFLLNQDNKFYIFDNNTGKKILDFETFPVILKQNNKQTLALDSKTNLYFLTSAGQLFSLDHRNYKINWLKNIKSTDTSTEFGLFYSSPIIAKDEAVYISSSGNTMSIDTLNGKTNWEIQFGTRIRPVVMPENIFLISKNGFALNVDRQSGKIIWSKKLFKSKNINLKKMGEVTSLLLISDQIFITTKNGFFIFVNYQDGSIINYAKVSKGFYSKPVVSEGIIYIIDKSKRILAFN